MNFDKFHSQLNLPYLETNYKFLPDIFRTLKLKFGLRKNSRQKLIDLGAGNGNIVIYSALNYEIKSYGIEIDQLLIKEKIKKINLLEKEGNYNSSQLNRVNIHCGDFYYINLSRYDFIYIYSLPSMHKYLRHVFSTARNGAIFVSHKYPFDDFNSILEDEYRLTHKNSKQEIYTYFYKKV